VTRRPFPCPGNALPFARSYLHTLFCRHRCAFCPFYINRASPGYSRDYADLLLREIAAHEVPARRVEAVFFGGGTPSDIEVEDLVRVLEGLRRQWRWADGVEITCRGLCSQFHCGEGAGLAGGRGQPFFRRCANYGY
jgi:oxygen-independent coproporphyrinogen-3 oxidase